MGRPGEHGAHAHQRVRTRRRGAAGEHLIGHDAHRTPQHRAHEQRRREHAARAARAERDVGRHHLEHHQPERHHQRLAPGERLRDRRVAASEDCRYPVVLERRADQRVRHRHRAQHQPADSRLQPFGDRLLVLEEVLRPVQ